MLRSEGLRLRSESVRRKGRLSSRRTANRFAEAVDDEADGSEVYDDVGDTEAAEGPFPRSITLGRRKIGAESGWAAVSSFSGSAPAARHKE